MNNNYQNPEQRRYSRILDQKANLYGDLNEIVKEYNCFFF